MGLSLRSPLFAKQGFTVPWAANPALFSDCGGCSHEGLKVGEIHATLRLEGISLAEYAAGWTQREQSWEVTIKQIPTPLPRLPLT